MKIALISLGCSKNLVDAEIMLGFIKKKGFRVVADAAQADIAVVNTCAFIRQAKEEAIEEIFQLVNLKKQGKLKKIIVAGCLPKRYKKELPALLKEADGFLGPGELDKIVLVIEEALKGENPFIVEKPNFLYSAQTPRSGLSPSHYAYLKIADGCNNRCSYCVIPSIRGSYRSRPMDSIVAEARRLSRQGVKEINLISQDTALYGADIYGKRCLDVLLKKLVKVKGIRWIRLLYLHPRHLDARLLEVIADEQKICKYLDLPIQHISDKILKLMHRHINAAEIKKLISRVRVLMPEAVLRTSLIVGFPGETEKDFEDLFNFVKETRFDRLGVFTYSPEEGTAAVTFKEKIPEKVKEKRLARLMKLQQEIVEEKNKSLCGKVREVLVDEIQKDGIAVGRTRYDAPEVDGVIFIKGKNIKKGALLKTEITGNYVYDLTGKLI